MSYGRRDRPDPADGGWAGLAEWTGGLPPEQIQALAAVRPFEAVHSLLRGLAGRTPRELLARAAVLEALASRKDDALSWLAEPARGETLRALRRSGWLKPGPDEPPLLTPIGRRVWDALRHAAPSIPEAAPLPPAVITPERIVRALLALSLEELAAAGREALLPVLAAPPLLTTLSVAKEAEAQAVAGGDDEGEGEDGRTGERKTRPGAPFRGGRRR